MSWFDRNAGEDPAAFYARLQAAVAESGILQALNAGAGPTGLRRFLVRAEAREGRVAVVGVEGGTLPRGGGPPSAAAWAAGLSGVEAALAKLRRLLPRHLEVNSLAAGFVRDESGEVDFTLRFEEDAAALKLAQLAEPRGAGAPTEDPAWLRTLTQWTSRVDELRAAYRIARQEWHLVDGRLDDGERRVPAYAIARWKADSRRFEWLLAEPVGPEAPLVEPELTVDLAGAIDLVCYAAARTGAQGVFQGADDTGALAFIALR